MGQGPSKKVLKGEIKQRDETLEEIKAAKLKEERELKDIIVAQDAERLHTDQTGSGRKKKRTKKIKKSKSKPKTKTKKVRKNKKRKSRTKKR